ncbi:hypothetical protein T05_989 [Trichinella murrelli]|uniref:Uncharacterized protein n=1 Tax=Trichinella murrelli TaxID=144512 RepID=A0A0V0TKQ5_9BILA|nr:hypothetical protein T05_989 [Trichinella murrelli]
MGSKYGLNCTIPSFTVLPRNVQRVMRAVIASSGFHKERRRRGRNVACATSSSVTSTVLVLQDASVTLP